MRYSIRGQLFGKSRPWPGRWQPTDQNQMGRFFTRCQPASCEKSLLCLLRLTSRLPGGPRPGYDLSDVSGLSTAPHFG